MNLFRAYEQGVLGMLMVINSLLCAIIAKPPTRYRSNHPKEGSMSYQGICRSVGLFLFSLTFFNAPALAAPQILAGNDTRAKRLWPVFQGITVTNLWWCSPLS